MPVVPEDSPWLILDGIQDPGNLGTILRTAEWFGFNLILATPSTVEALNPKVVSAAMGSLFRIRPKVLDQQTIFEMLKKNQYELVVSSLDGDGMPKVWPDKIALVIGSESHGVSDFWLNKADLLIKIPSFGKAESLNAAIAFGILAADYRL
jgi:TrmH family RNA methyltransferase